MANACPRIWNSNRGLVSALGLGSLAPTVPPRILGGWRGRGLFGLGIGFTAFVIYVAIWLAADPVSSVER
jgi:hypothetical protein